MNDTCSTQNSYIHRLLKCLLPMLIAGCGGGGGGGSNSEGSEDKVTPFKMTRTLPADNSVTGSVGIIDSGLSPDRPEFNYERVNFISVLANDNNTLNDNLGLNGHGTLVALAIAGIRQGRFGGGISPDSQLYIAQTSESNIFNYRDVSRAVNSLIGRGVKIINMSFASSERLTTNDELQQARNNGGYQLLQNALRNIVAADALAVVPTGNNGTSTPSPNTQLPLIFNEPSLKRGLIAVTGYLPNPPSAKGDRPDALWNFDACGNAAEWCLSAPGYIDYNPQDALNSSKLTRAFGTSFAAPRVAGAASLVQQTFPWMTGSNLQQTLLTTANYRRDDFVKQTPVENPDGTRTFISQPVGDSSNGRPFNDSFGWGDLNVEKALKGPGMFWANDFSARLDSGDYTFSNNITGTHGLILNGSQNNGALHLTGDNDYRGITQVLANSLLIDGRITGNAQVSGGGLIGGKGIIGGNLLNQGNVQSSVKVRGDYRQTAEGTLHVELNTPLQVTGHAELDGAIKVTPPGAKYLVKSREILLSSDKGIQGKFSTVDTGTFLSGMIEYENNTVTGLLTRKNVVEALTGQGLGGASLENTAENVESAFKVADNWLGKNDLTQTQQEALGKAAVIQVLPNADMVKQTFSSLSGEAHASGNALLFNTLDYQSRLLNNRIEEADSKKHYGMWFESGQLRGSLAQQGFLGNHYRSALTAIGADSDFDIRGLRLGAAYTYNLIDANYQGNGGTSQNTLHGIMLYSRYWLSLDWYLQGNLSFQHGRESLNRTVLLDQAEKVTSQTRSNSWHGLLQTGYRWQINDRYHIEPYVGWRETMLKTGRFQDKGSNFGLSGDGARYQRSVGYSGLSLGTLQSFQQGWWGAITINTEKQHAFSNPSLDLRARWNGFGDSTGTFDVQGMQLDRDSIWSGIRIDVGQTRDARLYVRSDRHFSARGNENVFRSGIDVTF